MATPETQTPPQWEGQEHQFLDYQLAVVHFIYSFSWDVTKRTWDTLRSELAAKKWKRRQLHERAFSVNGDVISSYQPSLVGKTIVLEKAGDVATEVTLLIPIEEYQGTSLRECRKLRAPLKYAVRLFDNGSGILTFSVHLSNKDCTFENIHLALHLANNVDYGDEPINSRSHLTNTFIQLPTGAQPDVDSLLPLNDKDSFTFSSGYCSLHDLFRRWIARHDDDKPPRWAPDRAKELWTDSDVLDATNPKQDFQTPFVFTATEVERNSFLRFRKSPTIDSAREVGSILCKLTLDNRFIVQHYLNLSEEYIKKVLPYSKVRGGLLNLCLDRRLFFAMSRRGAIALTARLADLPACFVIPSFLNLCEILRGRWHIGSVVSARLDQAISELADAISAGSNTETSPLAMMEKMVKWRLLSAAFLRDPVPFLFDGGSVCEMAEQCEKLLWLDRLRTEVTGKFQLLDQLVRDYLNIDRHRRLSM